MSDLERKEMRIQKNRASAERSRQRKFELIDALEHELSGVKEVIGEMRKRRNVMRSLLPLESFPSSEESVNISFVTSDHHSIIEPAMEETDVQNYERLCSPLTETSEDCDASSTFDDCSVMGSSTDSSITSSVFSLGSSGKSSDCSLKEKQRLRRLRRMEIMRNKRLSRSSQSSSNSSVEPALTRTPVRFVPSPNAHVFESGEEPLPTDPKLLRKLKNRLSAERSRQKINDSIDNLSLDLLAHRCILNELQSELQALLTAQEQFGLMVPSFPAGNGEYYNVTVVSTNSCVLNNEIAHCSDANSVYCYNYNNSNCFDESVSSVSSSNSNGPLPDDNSLWCDLWLDGDF